MGQQSQNSSFEVIDLASEAAKTKGYDNHSIATVNDHEVRISTMTESYHRHCHPDSDESFPALEGACSLILMTERLRSCRDSKSRRASPGETYRGAFGQFDV